MRILSKKCDGIVLISSPQEELEVGEFLLIEDGAQKRSLVAQVYDQTYVESISLEEDLLKEELISSSLQPCVEDPLRMSSFSSMLKDMRVIKCKIRGTIENGSFVNNVAWLPSRPFSKIRRVSVNELFKLIGRDRVGRKVVIGSTLRNEPFSISVEDLDGRINIITGRKETGKSHLAKLLFLSLLQHGAYVMVFDLNNEYAELSQKLDGSESEIARKLVLLYPGKNLRFTLRYLGKRSLMNLMLHLLETPGVSLRELSRILDFLEARGSLTFRDLGEAIENWKMNELVRDALITRYSYLRNSRIFTDNEEENFDIAKLCRAYKEGAGILVELAKASPLTRRMVVEVLLNKIVDSLEEEAIPPIFLFGEESHLYLRETYWEDIVTRMRHFGIFTTFITNQPNSLRESIYRQADTIFLFNFANEKDLEMIARASIVDSETVVSIAKTLRQGYCLVIGKVTENIPVLAKISELNLRAGGRTKRFFEDVIDKRKRNNGHLSTLLR